ncbi:energy transducer TonB [Sphingomonas sp. BGYR3]|uniref:energy transducer TonB n=1 Tax=Sphingomonas sp. BGYR3 TaxID=2975483 RepID=UPI0021A42417|nr:energy transducer TonB [Sphingomonas sp. BGYR3]MDG5489508.1 energy transducer TonB [Sphingomonas sp. BGYR3]
MRPRRERWIALAGSAAAVGGIIAVLLIGLSVTTGVRIDSALDVFDISVPPPPPPPPEPVPKPAASEREAGAAAPPALKARPKPVTAPPVPPRKPPPLAAPPVAADGTAARAGASERPGPGTGAGGVGSGLGSGGAGDGTGGGAARAKRVRGSISNRDYPPSAYRAGAGGRVIVTLTVAADGRVTGCLIARSSGNAALDEATCSLARKRFRYTPARDASGKPVESQAGYRQDWWLEGQAPPAP